jgi:diguanylate cyclase (GGDEF)-like protein/PAS domain S-box-containing protein
MSWRRLTGSLRVRMAFAFSALLLVAVSPLLLLLTWRAPEGAPLALGFAVMLLVAQCLLIAHFTAFARPLADWARALVRGAAPLQPPLPDTGAPELRELNHLLAEGAYTVRHHTQALAETRELFEHSEYRLQKWVNKAGEILFELDTQGKILFLNPAWETLTGFALADTIGKPLAGFLCEEDVARDFGSGSLAELRIRNREATLRSADGRRLWVNLSAESDKDGTGHFVGVSGVMGDISQNVELRQLITRYEDELYQLSVIDPLTGLYNRRHFDIRLEAILADHLPRRQPVCLLLIDLDGFKFINDTYGHPFGDEVLRTMTYLLREQVRRNDYVARMAGNEFAMVLKNTGLETATHIARKLHTRINETHVPLPVGHMRLQASIGIAEAPTHGTDAQGLVSAADVALYHSRRHGPNRIETLSPDMSKATISIFSQGFQLRRALEAGDIHPAFQPIYDMRTGKPVAYEVLARMRLDGTIIQAKDFIGVAQELGLTREMDLLVIRQALACAPPDQALFLNIDMQSFNDREFVDELIELLEPTCAAGRRITVEITERESVTPNESLTADIQRLRALGCQLALDDFGSGYSTYKFLDLFCPDYLKIEGSFVRGMLENESDRKIVMHIHELAQSFGMETIAESVENASTEKALRKIGIRNAQGLHFGAPKLIT